MPLFLSLALAASPREGGVGADFYYSARVAETRGMGNAGAQELQQQEGKLSTASGSRPEAQNSSRLQIPQPQRTNIANTMLNCTLTV